MKKISKKECKELLNSVEKTPFGWSVYCVYTWLDSKGKIQYFVQYNGQGTLDCIYNDKVQYTSWGISELTGDYYTIKEKVDYMQETINEHYDF